MADMNRYGEASVALPRLAGNVMRHGEEMGSRQGERVMELLHQNIELARPWNREILTPGRKASLPAQIAETMWVLAGRNDVAWLSHYLPRAADFSDDGEQWRGGYGPRLRTWAAMDDFGKFAGSIDQLAHVVDLLRRDHSTRRAVMSIYDPAVDTDGGKDIPCNNWLHFLNRGGYMHLHIATRSNDLMWGWSGINQFEWSVLLEIVAAMVGVKVGTLQFSIGSLHIYDRHWKKAREMDPHDQVLANLLGSTEDSPRFAVPDLHRSANPLGQLNHLVKKWFNYEDKLRTRTWSVEYARDMIDGFPEPMLQSWLRVIAYHWYGQEAGFLTPLHGTRLALAAGLSPSSPVKHPEPQPVKVLANGGMLPGVIVDDPFINFVVKLHEEKDAVYGDSWKRRGEAVAIQANIARKVDRLGVAGAGDTAADTVIDLLVYLVKYRLWLTDTFGSVPVPASVAAGVGTKIYSEDPHYVELYLRKLPLGRISEDDAKESIAKLKSSFGTLLLVERPVDRSILVQGMILDALPVARRLWEAEQPPEPKATITNENRPWAGYEDEEGSK